MKTKTFKTKLSLNKKTVSNLSNNELSQVKGGGTRLGCWLYETCEFYTCDCTFYCTDATKCYNCYNPTNECNKSANTLTCSC
jgi:bacteriocin-like protein